MGRKAGVILIVIGAGAAFYFRQQIAAAIAGFSAMPAPQPVQPQPATTILIQPPRPLPAVAIAPTPQPVPTPAPITPNTGLIAELVAASAGDPAVVGGNASADVWSFYLGLNHPPLTPAQFGQAFPNMTADRGPLMTAAEFVARVQGVGLAGLPAISRIPFELIHLNRRQPVWLGRWAA